MVPISVIVPVYNAAKYLENTATCILSQSFTNFELILVDDGSTDGSGEICDILQKKDTRIKVIHQENRGVSSARNTGIDIATGEFICFVDADDEIENNMLETLYNNALKYNVDISCCGILQKDLSGKINNKFCTGETVYITDNEILLKNFFDDPVYREVLYGPYNKIIKSEIVKQTKFNEKFAIGEDLLFSFECIEKSKSFYFDNIGLYHYIKRPHSATTSSFSTKRFDYISVADILLDKCNKKHNKAYNSALYWVYIHKQNMWRSLNKHTAFKKEHKDFYLQCKAFCKQNISFIWKNLSFKKRVDYILLNVFPIIYKII